MELDLADPWEVPASPVRCPMARPELPPWAVAHRQRHCHRRVSSHRLDRSLEHLLQGAAHLRSQLDSAFLRPLPTLLVFEYYEATIDIACFYAVLRKSLANQVEHLRGLPTRIDIAQIVERSRGAISICLSNL